MRIKNNNFITDDNTESKNLQMKKFVSLFLQLETIVLFHYYIVTLQ